jgi:hypothetical protein
MTQPSQRINRNLTGIAGVHHVVSELSRRGLIALPTTRNTAAYDIIVTTVDGKKHANIQVKTTQRNDAFFLMPSSERVRTGKHDYYVLLRWLQKEQKYYGLLLSGRTAKKEVVRGENYQKKKVKAGTRKKVTPSIYTSKKVATRVNHWHKAWLAWSL